MAAVVVVDVAVVVVDIAVVVGPNLKSEAPSSINNIFDRCWIKPKQNLKLRRRERYFFGSWGKTKPKNLLINF